MQAAPAIMIEPLSDAQYVPMTHILVGNAPSEATLVKAYKEEGHLLERLYMLKERTMTRIENCLGRMRVLEDLLGLNDDEADDLTVMALLLPRVASGPELN
jgi:hypothetical protein